MQRNLNVNGAWQDLSALGSTRRDQQSKFRELIRVFMHSCTMIHSSWSTGRFDAFIFPLQVLILLFYYY